MSFSIDCLTPHPPSPSKRLIPDLAHCGVVGLLGGWVLLGLWGLRGLGCALTWGYELDC